MWNNAPMRSGVSASVRHRAAKLALVDVTAVRASDPAYTAYRLRQTAHLVARLRSLGWQVRHCTAAEESTAALRRATDGVDAVILGGGEDIDPRFYGEDRGYAHESAHFPAADERQIALVLRTAARGVPLLGICRGMQVINVAFGGTLRRDLGEQSEHQNHGCTYANAIRIHAARLATSSRLAGALSGEPIPVASGHHQAVERVGAGLRTVARADDGVIEAVEGTQAPVFGVQWHPESAHAARVQLPALSDLLRRAAIAPAPVRRAVSV